MALKEQLEADLKSAMLSKDDVARDTLRLLLADLKRLSVQDGKELTPDLEQNVLLKAVKQRHESIAQFEKARRDDLAAKEKSELAVLQTYLPEMMSDADTRAAVQAVMAELKLSSKKDMGTVMKTVMARYKGQVDGKSVQKMLGEMLT